MFKTLFKPGDALLTLLLLLPVLVFSLAWSPASNLTAWLNDSGRLSGVLGLSLLLLAALMSIRLPRLDVAFGGLPRIWQLHRLAGFGGFMLVLLHVWCLAFAGLAGGLDGALARLFPPGSAWAIWLGWAALLCLVIFLAPTFRFFGRLHYQRWKALHLLSVPALLLALAHSIALTTPSWHWWLLGVGALGAIVWRKLLSPRLGRSDWTVEAVTPLATGVVELTLAPMGQPLQYQPGQFVYLTPRQPLLSAGNNQEHPYTLSSAPGETRLRLGIKKLGDASAALQHIAIGSRVQVEGPYGDFYQRHYPHRDQLWLGGGIGITPFVSGARAIAEGWPVKAQLFYLCHDPERAYYLEELDQIATQNPAFKVTPHFLRSEGPLSLAFLEAHCPDFRQREVYLCGPPGMVNHLKPLLRQAGLPLTAIHTEVFDFL